MSIIDNLRYPVVSFVLHAIAWGERIVHKKVLLVVAVRVEDWGRYPSNFGGVVHEGPGDLFKTFVSV